MKLSNEMETKMKLSNELHRDEIAEAKKYLTDVLDDYCDKWK